MTDVADGGCAAGEHRGADDEGRQGGPSTRASDPGMASAGLTPWAREVQRVLALSGSTRHRRRRQRKQA
jgi:hypothetical protein